MKKKRKSWACTMFLLTAACLSGGCSPVFSGVPVFGKEEVVLECNETFPDPTMPPEHETLPDMEQREVVTDSEEKVDLNTATLDDLMTLKGIGKTRAQAILSYRETQGRFACIEDIMKISGIKEGIFEKIKDQIVVR